MRDTCPPDRFETAMRKLLLPVDSIKAGRHQFDPPLSRGRHLYSTLPDAFVLIGVFSDVLCPNWGAGAAPLRRLHGPILLKGYYSIHSRSTVPLTTICRPGGGGGGFRIFLFRDIAGGELKREQVPYDPGGANGVLIHAMCVTGSRP